MDPRLQKISAKETPNHPQISGPPPTSFRTSLPIIEHVHVALDRNTQTKLERAAARLLASEKDINSISAFGDRVRCGISDAPALFIEDHSMASLFKPDADNALEYRTFLLGGKGDFFALGSKRSVAFETYCHRILKLGAEFVLTPTDTPDTAPASPFKPISRLCAEDPAMIETLCEAARRSGEFNIIPYQGSGHIWRLAEIITARSGAVVNVAAPPPRLGRRVNDKIWFAQRVRDVFASDAAPLTYSIFGPAALAARLRFLAARYPRVAIKVPDSAGSAGNVVIHAAQLNGQSLERIVRQVVNTLLERGWQKHYPLLIGVWEHPVLDSPSVNFWIPRLKHGAPVLEGIFSQTLTGENGEFSGAIPTRLTPELETRLAYEASCLARYLQLLGYFGRCGFDSIIIGDTPKAAELHWIECNGRWGGVSIPITVANKMLGDWSGTSPLIVQHTDMNFPPKKLSETVAALKSRLLSPPKHPRGVMILAPQRLIDGTGLHIMILEDSDEKSTATLAAVKAALGRKNRDQYC